MKKLIIFVVAVIIIIGGVLGVYLYFSQPSAEPSQDAQNSVEHLVQSSNPDQKLLHIIPEQSMATYELNEVLNGIATHVLGTTQDVAGDIGIITKAPQSIQIGQVKINARTFKTDINQRDNNVRKLVLKSDDPTNEFITFKTTDVSGVPATIEANKDFPITITGDATIAGVTKPITFNGTANLSNSDTLTVNASAMVTYENFGIVVPNFSFLADVDKTVKLSVHLVAN